MNVFIMQNSIVRPLGRDMQNVLIGFVGEHEARTFFVRTRDDLTGYTVGLVIDDVDCGAMTKAPMPDGSTMLSLTLTSDMLGKGGDKVCQLLMVKDTIVRKSSQFRAYVGASNDINSTAPDSATIIIISEKITELVHEAALDAIEEVQEVIDSIPADYSTLSAQVDTNTEDIGGLKADLGDVKEALILPTYKWTLRKNVDAVGNIVTNNYTSLTDLITCAGGDRIIRTGQAKDGTYTLIYYVNEYTNGIWNKRTALNPSETIVLESATNGVRIGFGRTSSSGVSITQADIDTYFSADFYRSLLPIGEYRLTGFMMRGNVIELGYTSFAECTKPGVYVFKTANLATITDAPDGLDSGGILKTYVNGSVVWQEILNNPQHYIRYGFTGPWFNHRAFVRVSYASGAGDDDSTEQLNIDVASDTKGYQLRYAMGHCVKETANANVWRLMYLYRITHTLATHVLTRKGEFECALHLADRTDFSGGIVHGDEVDRRVTFIGDGKILTAANASGFYKKFIVVRNSYLYDPNDSTTVIAEHGCEYIFTPGKLTINQSVKWLVSETLTNCYLAMYPVLKTYSANRYDDTDFKVTANPESGLSVTIPNAKCVTEYSGNVLSKMSVPTYPTGLTGGDCALLSDNGGLPYNKVYFPICSSGQTQIGEMWKSSTEYEIQLTN